MHLWETAVKLLPNTALRRATVLKKIGVTEEQAWGRGVHIFAPVSRPNNCTGSKLRFLPMLSNTRIDSFRVEKRNITWTKQHVISQIMKQCTGWLSQPYLLNEQDRSFHKIASAFATMPFDEWFSTDFAVKKLSLGKNYNIKTISSLLRIAEEAGLVSKVVKTTKRLRGWEIEEYANPPWGL